MTDLLYHYTNTDGLLGILRSRQLWASNVFFLNDAREFAVGFHAGRAVLEARLNLFRASYEPQRPDLLDPGVANQWHHIDWLLRGLGSGGPSDALPIFVASLTEADDLLSQWRAYCRGGGFCIGFPKDQVTALASEQDFSLQRCSYERAMLDQAVAGVIEKEVGQWLREAAETDSSPMGRGGEYLCHNLNVGLATTAPAFKDVAFAEEREWRLISNPSSTSRPSLHDERVRVRNRTGLLVPYSFLALPDNSEFWERVTVRIGPTPHPELQQAALGVLVSRHAPGIKVSQTSVPLRDW